MSIYSNSYQQVIMRFALDVGGGNIVISIIIRTFAPELTWTDLSCLQPQKKMLKKMSFCLLPLAAKILPLLHQFFLNY